MKKPNRTKHQQAGCLCPTDMFWATIWKISKRCFWELSRCRVTKTTMCEVLSCCISSAGSKNVKFHTHYVMADKISFILLGRLRRVDLIIWVRCPSVRTSTKCFSDSDEIWYVGRGRRVMHDGMPYDPIQGQGHETFKVRNSSIFKIYLIRHF